MLRVDSIFFDVDGTLVDSREDIVGAANHALHALGLPEKKKELIVSYVGTGVRDLIKKSLGAKQASLVEEAVDIFSRYYMAHSHDKSTLYPHVKEILEYFKDKRKYILTNRYRRFADATLKGLGVRSYFEEIFGGDDENCLKPLPCVLDKIFLELKLNKARTIVVGDMAIDVKTGKNSGVATCWVTYGLGKPEEIKPLKPDYIIDDILELKEVIR